MWCDLLLKGAQTLTRSVASNDLYRSSSNRFPTETCPNPCTVGQPYPLIPYMYKLATCKTDPETKTGGWNFRLSTRLLQGSQVANFARVTPVLLDCYLCTHFVVFEPLSNVQVNSPTFTFGSSMHTRRYCRRWDRYRRRRRLLPRLLP